MHIYSIYIYTLHGKPYFLFPDVKWSFQKKSCWNMIFLVLSGKIIYLFPKNMILHLRQNMKADLSQKKIHGNMTFSSSLSKDATLGHDLSCIIWKNGIFSLGRKWEIFLKKYIEIWYFLCTHTGVINVAPRPSVKKNQRWSCLAKIHVKVIDVLDWHPRRSSSNSLYLQGDPYRRFRVLLSSEKKQET